MKNAPHEQTRLEPLPERLEMDPDDMTSDALLGARVEDSARVDESAQKPALPSLTVTPEARALTDASAPDADARMQDKGMRGKFVRFLERETTRKRQNLGEVRRRSCCEADGDRQEQLLSISDRLADELGQLEALLDQNREALVDEHLEIIHDRRSCIVSTSSDSFTAPSSSGSAECAAPPIHWRARAKNIRRTPYQMRRPDSGSCGSSDGKRNSADSDASKMDASAQRASASQVYCRSVSRTVAPIINPIDKALGKFSNLVHGPVHHKNGPAPVPPLPSRPAACGEQQGQKKSAAQLRKEITREFWAYMMCGPCAPNTKTAEPINHPSAFPRPETEELPEQAIREMEKKIEQDVNRLRPQRLEPRIEPDVPASSLEISGAANAIAGSEVAEAVVELHMSREVKGDAKSDARDSKGSASLADARRALIHSLGSKSQARLCQPQPDPVSPMTPLPDGLSPVSHFLARMAFEQASGSASASKSQQVPAEPAPACVEQGPGVKFHTELCGDLVAQSSLEFEAGGQYRASSIGSAGRFVVA